MFGKKRIFIATTSFGSLSNEPLSLLLNAGYKVDVNNKGRKLNENELANNLSNCEGVIAGTEKYSGEILKTLNNLKVVSRLGVGMDNIDLLTARKLKIKIFKTNTTPAPAVAELVLGLMIDVARNVSKSSHDLKSGEWKKQMGSLLQGKTLGIIGLGTIGKALVKLTRGFGFKVLAFDLKQDDNYRKDYHVTYCDLSTLLEESDIVSIHLNLSVQTNMLINKKQLDFMKPDAILINTSRGEIIDENALYDALKYNKLSGAGLDVFHQEPYSGPLTKLNNIVLTPHIGAYAKEVRVQMEIEASENLIRGLNET